MDPEMTCYRHPDRRAGVVCQRCDRPICPSCMHTASVGFHCPECAGANKQKVIPMRAVKQGSALGTPYVTLALIAVNIAVELVSLANGATAGEARGSIFERFALYGPSVGINHEWYRVITGGFLHSGLLHIGLNMYALWILGSQIETALGRIRFSLIFAGGLIAGSAAVMVLSPNEATVGASGAIFGIFGAAFIMQRAAGIDPWRSPIARIIGLNLLITFLIPGISKGGHLGGLAGGVLVAWVLIEGPRRLGSKQASYVAAGAVVVLYFVIALVAASQISYPA
jgi:membrane associated rhomboid family serine protease